MQKKLKSNAKFNFINIAKEIKVLEVAIKSSIEFIALIIKQNLHIRKPVFDNSNTLEKFT